MKDLNREIIMREIFAAEEYAAKILFLAEGGKKFDSGKLENHSEEFREYRRLQADYLLSKFRMILIEK